MLEAEHYSYRVFWSPEDAEFVGVCSEFPSLSHLAKDQEGALTGIRELVGFVVSDLRASGEHVPLPLTEHRFSGDLRLRLPTNLHRQLALEAAETQKSLNRTIIDRLIGFPAPALPTPPRRRATATRPAAKAATKAAHRTGKAARAAKLQRAAGDLFEALERSRAGRAPRRALSGEHEAPKAGKKAAKRRLKSA